MIARIFRQMAVAVSHAQIDRSAAVTSAWNRAPRLCLPGRSVIEKISARARIYLNLNICRLFLPFVSQKFPDVPSHIEKPVTVWRVPADGGCRAEFACAVIRPRFVWHI